LFGTGCLCGPAPLFVALGVPVNLLSQGGVIVHIGDALMEWTNGRWHSNVHRVALPPPEAAAESRRQSIVFFQMLNFDTPMRPLDLPSSPTSGGKSGGGSSSNGGSAAAKNAKPVLTYGEYLAKKMGAMNRKEEEGSAAIYDMSDSESIYRGQVDYREAPQEL